MANGCLPMSKVIIKQYVRSWRSMRPLGMTAAIFVLSACLVPEKFTASYNFKPSGDFTYHYDGTAKDVMTLMMQADAKQKNRPLPEKEIQGLRAEMQKLGKAPNVTNFKDLGDATYQLVYEKDFKVGQKQDVLPIAQISKDKSGVYTVSATPLKPKDAEQFKMLGVKLDGTVEVRLPSNAKVISHDANDTPGFFSKAYGWKMNLGRQKMEIKFTLS